jgi:DNA-binding response OmpR family regulator
MMPRLDGFDLCRAIKADREIDFIPIILLTARAGTDDRLEGLGTLADDYVTKPFDARELLARADNLIALRRRLRERYAAAAPAETAADIVPLKPSDDELYRQRLIAVIDQHLSDEAFRITDLSRLMAQDRTQLFRRTRDVTGEAPSDFIRNRRLARAAELLRAREGQVGEVAYAVGFNSVSYFIKCFRESYGVTPARFAETSNAVS